MPVKRSDEPDEAATPSGQLPGINGSPFGPSFRAGPRVSPDLHPVRSLVLGLIPVVIVLVVVFLTTRR